MPFSGIKVQEQSYFYFNTKYLVKSQVNTNLRFFKEQDGKNVKVYSFATQCHCQKTDDLLLKFRIVIKTG